MMTLIKRLFGGRPKREPHPTWSLTDQTEGIPRAELNAMLDEALARYEERDEADSLQYRICKALREEIILYKALIHMDVWKDGNIVKPRKGQLNARRIVWSGFTNHRLDKEGYKLIVFEITEHDEPYAHRSIEPIGLCTTDMPFMHVTFDHVKPFPGSEQPNEPT